MSRTVDVSTVYDTVLTFPKGGLHCQYLYSHAAHGKQTLMMKKYLFVFIVLMAVITTASAQHWQEEFKNPIDEYRIFHMVHAFGDNYETYLNTLYDYGFRGVITNNAWDENFLKNSSNYALMNAAINKAHEMGMTVWLYDEYGYPSGTADHQTLDGYPEYEAIGIGLLSSEHTNKAEFTLPEAFQKILYAEIILGSEKTPLAELGSSKMDERKITVNVSGTFTLNVYAQKIAFEGSHAEKNGFRPNRYPNLLNKDAVQRFIDLVYVGYKNNVEDMSKVQAIFTDEPSLMTHFVNTTEKYPYSIVPWEDRLPAHFKKMHGYDLMPRLSSLFGGYSDEDKILRVNFYQTVAEMMTQSFYIPLRDFCEKLGIAFSGHNLLEETLSCHVGLYGDMMQNIGTMQIPGIDVLSCVPPMYLKSWYMTPKYVSSAARNNGKDVVMVEFCPVADMEQFQVDEFKNVLGTTSLLFFNGANRFNTYYAYHRMSKENAIHWNEYSGRLNTLLRGSTFASEIAVMYPIANTQAYFTAENTHFHFPDGNIHSLDMYFNHVATQLYRSQLDFNILDAESLEKATIENGKLVIGNGAYRVMVIPKIEVMSLESMRQLSEFADGGGKVIWLDSLPRLATRAEETAEVQRLAEKYQPDVVNFGMIKKEEEKRREFTNIIKDTVKHNVRVTSRNENFGDLFVSPYIKEGKKLYYVVNSNNNDMDITITSPGPFDLYDPFTGSITSYNNAASVVCKGYMGYFVVERF